jgi:hypothetical protein
MKWMENYNFGFLEIFLKKLQAYVEYPDPKLLLDNYKENLIVCCLRNMALQQNANLTYKR